MSKPRRKAVAAITSCIVYLRVSTAGQSESGLGREGSHEGIEEWLETKHLCWGGIA